MNLNSVTLGRFLRPEWQKRKTEVAAAVARRKEVESRTVDWVAAGNVESERDHGFKGEGDTGNFDGETWRGARNGWFSYELKVGPDKPITLVHLQTGENVQSAFLMHDPPRTDLL